MLARFSTVAGEMGSPHSWRDVRVFSLKFYTDEGNYDLIGNNTPIFFVLDPMEFPHLIRSQKRLPDSGLRDNHMQRTYHFHTNQGMHFFSNAEAGGRSGRAKEPAAGIGKPVRAQSAPGSVPKTALARAQERQMLHSAAFSLEETAAQRKTPPFPAKWRASRAEPPRGPASDAAGTCLRQAFSAGP